MILVLACIVCSPLRCLFHAVDMQQFWGKEHGDHCAWKKRVRSVCRVGWWVQFCV